MLQSLKHKLKLTITTFRLISGESHLVRKISTATPSLPHTSPPARKSSKQSISKYILQKKLWEAVNKHERVSDCLHRIMRDGGQFFRSDLLSCLQTLRKFGHYNQCLEIFEWMDNGRIGYSAIEHALRLNIMSKVKDIDDVEKYFDSIPPDVKNHCIYGALLNYYCTHMMTNKALALFKKMDELNYVSIYPAFSNLMELYIKVGEPEKVSLLVEEMKRRNIPLTNHTYYIWIQSYRLTLDLEGVEQVMHEVQERISVREDWEIYCNLAAVYIDAGQFEKANTALKKMEELIDNPKKAERQAYHYLITMYASIGNLESLYLAWHKLKLKFKDFQNICYLTMLRALSMLDDIEGLKNYLEEWELSCKHYDDRLPAVVIGTYLRHDMLEEAKHLLKKVEDRVQHKTKYAHVIFMKYYLRKHQFDFSLMHMEVAMAAKWKPQVEKLDPFFKHFKEEKDVDSAEEFCRKLEEVQLLNSRTYLWLLQTYEAAGKAAPDMRQRMEKNGVDISTEHEELLQKIC